MDTPPTLHPEPVPPRRRRWGLWIFLFVVFLCFMVGISLIMGFISLVKGNAVQVSPDSTLVIDLSYPLQEQPPSPIATELFKAKIYTMSQIDTALQKASQDERIRSVLLKFGYVPMGFGRMQELQGYLEEFKKSGKPVWAYFEMTGTAGYYVASSADRVYAPPSALLAMTGLMAEVPFYRGSLDKLHVEPQFFHAGKYKSGSDPYMMTEMSEAMREDLNSLLDGLYGQVVGGISRGRNLDEAEAKALIDQGFIWGAELEEMGLVDGLMYEDEIQDGLREINANQGRWNHIDAMTYVKDTRVDPYADAKHSVALIIANGDIVSGESTDNYLGSDSVVRWLRSAGRNSKVKAVVLRVNSPGGSPLASDVIWREIQVVRKEKPVVISMSDVAASGGYWISMSSDGIVAQPGTITGSIGVYGGKFVLKGFFEWLGMNHEQLKRGENADMFSVNSSFTPEQERLWVSQMEAVYDQFITKVSEGRGMPRGDVEKIAGGRVWTGEQGLANGLVDRLGGVREAVELAKEKAKIPKADTVRLVMYPRKKSLFEALMGVNMDEMARARTLSKLPPEMAEAYRRYLALQPLCQEPVLALEPVRVFAP